MKKFIVILFTCFASYMLQAGEGFWLRRHGLKDTYAREYGIFDRVQTNMDGMMVENYKGYVYLDYTRKNQSDIAVNQHEWRVRVNYSYFLAGQLQNGFVAISYEDGNYKYTDFKEVPCNIIQRGYKIRVTSIAASYSTNGTNWIDVAHTDSHIPDDIDLRLELRSERMFDLNLVDDKSILSSNPTTYEIKWNYIEGAEEYDLEWVHIDDESVEKGIIAAEFSDPEDLGSGGYALPFRLKEPSRVRVWGTQYQLDKTFTKGIIYFRVRAVSRFTTNGQATEDIRTGAWNYFNTTNLGTITASKVFTIPVSPTAEFEPAKNWLFGVSYAEQGKSVSSVTIFDGSNRGRQNLVYNTSDNVTLVSESKYDYEGRQTISVIPAPIKGRKLGYKTNFNLASLDNEFSEEDFDEDGPHPLFSPTSGESGAAQYFSPNNQFTEDMFRSAIPNAQGYVYSQTVYRNDGTGRIERVGGIGEEFKADGDHAIETFYGSPMPVELKRLFGSNVSDDLNGYRKEMVKDANDQYSVTYYDKRGNVIATGLTGDSPKNLIQLENTGQIQNYTTTLNNNNNEVDPYTKVSEHTFLNPQLDNEVVFSYSLQGALEEMIPEPITIGGQTMTFASFCSSCEYDLTVEIVDQQGNRVSIVPQGQEHFGPATCNGTSLYSYDEITFPFTFESIGEYRIIKTLTVDGESMEAAFEAQLAGMASLDEQEFIDNYVANVDLSSCFDNCGDYCAFNALRQTAIANQMTVAELKDNLISYPNSPLAYQVQAYSDACEAETCDAEYWLNEATDSGNLPEGVNAAEQNLCHVLRQQMKQQMEPEAVFWSLIPVDINGNPKTDYEGADPERSWTDELAEQFLPLHREYCHLATCGAWEASLNYSNKLQFKLQQNGWNAASALFLQPYNTDVAGSTADPFVNSIFNGNDHDLIQNAVSSRTYTLCNNVAFTGSLAAYADAQGECLADASLDNADPNDDITGDEIDQLKINLFLGTYNLIKQELIDAYKAELNPACTYYQDINVVFQGMQSIDQMEQHILNDVNVINSAISCGELALNNTYNWLDQIQDNCLIDMGIMNSNLEYTFNNVDLANSTSEEIVNQTIAELFYNFTLATCPQNMYALFYNPDSDDSGVDPQVSGEGQYDQTKVLLEDCLGTDPFPFEVSYSDLVPDNSTIPTEQELETEIQYLVDQAYPTSNLLQNPITITVSNIDFYGNLHPEIGLELNDVLYVTQFQHVFSNNHLGKIKILKREEEDHDLKHTYSFFTISGGGCSFKGVLTDNAFATNIWEVYADQINLTPQQFFQFPYLVNYRQTFSGGMTHYPIATRVAQSCFLIPQFDIPLPNYVADCIASEQAQATIDAQIEYDQMLDGLRNEFAQLMLNCIDTAVENFEMNYNLQEDHYTLYYYDLANNLVQTVPPQGVHVLTPGEVEADTEPDHQLETRYQYNGLNTLVAQFTPDGGRTDFYLDRLYRVRFSQNARQVVEDKASYSKYDPLGRVEEAGEFVLLGDDLGTLSAAEAENNAFPGTNRMLDFTKTYYEQGAPDASIAVLFGGVQENLRNAIGAVEHRQAEYTVGSGVTVNPGSLHKTVISYSYDPHKNVKQVVNTNYDLASIDQQHKTTEYEYDLISGNVNEVIYQRARVDQYRHQYHYDANNRLVRAFTSDNDGLTWEQDAKYFYYLHGALARTELGHDKVQGLDYAYNLQGWLKGVNSATLQRNRDLGHDANSGLNENFGQDIMGFQLGYHETDYASIGNVTAFANTQQLFNRNDHTDNVSKANLFNGNISHMVTAISNTDEEAMDILGNNYRYDQLQRIKAMDVFHNPNITNSNSFEHALFYHQDGTEGAYQERYSFDKNGNITQLTRNGSGRNGQGTPVAFLMDNFTYHYYEQGDDASATTLTPWNSNRLARVHEALDDVNNPDAYTADVRFDPAQHKYEYDASGQLMTDLREGIENIEWTVTGKVKFIKFTDQSNKEDIQFLYDPMDRRIAKIVYNSPTEQTHTYYSHDAQGNVLATYKRQISIEDGNTPNYDQYAETFTLSDHHIYGSQRIGVENQHKRILTAAQLVPETGFPGVPGQITIQNATFDYTERLVGDKNYELSNHLGNVLNVITDRKLGITDFADVIDFEGPDPSVGSVQPCGDINHWYSNGGTNVSLQEMGANNTGWRIQHTLGNFGGSNINICQVIGEQYTLTVNVLEKSSNAITFVVRDYPSNSFITSQSLQLGQNTFTYTYTGANSGARLQFQITGAGYYVIDDLSISGAGMDVQYPGTAVYTADVVSYADYGPYGTLLDGRHGNEAAYKYGFNGMEGDDEVKGEGNSYDYGARFHDPRIGRFLSIDPKAMSYPFMSPYCYAGNNPIVLIDNNGEGPIIGWLLKGMTKNEETKTYIIEYDITISRDILLVNMSTLSLTASEGKEIAQSIADKYAASDFTYTITDRQELISLDYMVRQQYSHIPDDYKIEFKVNINFQVGTVGYMVTKDPSTINNDDLLIGIVDNVKGEELGLSLSKDAVLVQREYISPVNKELENGEVLEASTVTVHEIFHEEGAGDTYTDVYNGCGVMGKEGTLFTLCEDTRLDIAVKSVSRSRAGHDVLMGKRAVPGYSATAEEKKLYQEAVKNKQVPGGSIYIDPSTNNTNGQQLKRMKDGSAN